MKHVWMLNHYAQEPGGAGGTRHFALARNLPAYGWKASIIAAGTEHGTGRQRLGPDDGAAQLQTIEDVPFLWLRTRGYSGNGWNRVANMLDYTLATLRSENLAVLEQPDVIIGSSVHPLAAWAGRRLAARYRVPFIFEVRDLWPQTLVDMGRIGQNHPVAVVLRALERSLYKSASKIIVLLPKASDYIQPLGIPMERIVWIPNGVDLDLFPAAAPVAHADSFTLTYFGAHGAANGLDNVLRAMRIVQDTAGASGIYLRLVGDGPEKPALIDMARSLELNNVSFEAPVPKASIPALAAQADAFVFNLIASPVFNYGISSNKLFDFMAAQRPILFCCDSTENPIAASGAGVMIPAEIPEALSAAILSLKAVPPSERQRMGEAGRRHLEENYSMARLAERLALSLEACVDNQHDQP